MTARVVPAALLLLGAGCLTLTDPAPAAPRRARGTVLVSMDTLRADFTTPYGAGPDATPSLAALAAEGVVFEHAYAQSNETLFSHGSAFTGRLPSHVAPVDYEFTIPDGTPTLASQMRAAGIRTGAVVASGHLARVFGLDDGFETYAETDWWGSLQRTVPMAVAWLDEIAASGQPFFLFVHGYDNHTAYVKPGVFARMATPRVQTAYGGLIFHPLFYEAVWGDTVYPDFPITPTQTGRGQALLGPDVYTRLPAYAARADVRRVPFSATDREFAVGTYESATFYADLWLGVLMEELRRRDMLDTTTVAVMSDHGEALLDHGFFNHRHTLRDVSTHVPLVVRPAGGVEPRRVAAAVSLLDVAPTLLELAGATASPGMEGRSLATCLSGECAATETPVAEGVLGELAVTDGTYRLIVHGLFPRAPGFDEAMRSGDGLTYELYELAEGEHRDLANDPAHAATITRLRGALRASHAEAG